MKLRLDGDALGKFYMSALFLRHFCMKSLILCDLSSIISFCRTVDVGGDYVYTNIKENSTAGWSVYEEYRCKMGMRE
jgi:hypothetical protein